MPRYMGQIHAECDCPTPALCSDRCAAEELDTAISPTKPTLQEQQAMSDEDAVASGTWKWK